MLIPHLHLGGRCREAIGFYQQAFGAQVLSVFDAGDEVAHAEMTIMGQRVMLNDRGGHCDRQTLGTLHLIVTFDSPEALRTCYERMQEGMIIIDPLEETGYSPLAVNFFDKYGVWWGFLVERP